MKLALLLAAFAGLELVNAASPRRTGHTADSVRALLGRGSHVLWDPVHLYQNSPWRRGFWEKTCGDALASYDCGIGTIHQSERVSNGLNGEERFYVNVEGGPQVGLGRGQKRFRVFDDGTSVDGWTMQDRKSIVDAHRRRKKLRKPLVDQRVHLSWRPVEAYSRFPHRKLFWEQICHDALEKKGCGAGIIHKGEIKLTKHNGDKTSYLNVQGAPSLGMEYGKKMRVFQDGTVQDGWSKWDKTSIVGAKRPRYTPKPADGPKALLSWEPANTYGRYATKKRHWEKRCQEALAKAGCGVGKIHTPEIKFTKADGTRSAYFNVEGAPSLGMEYGKKMRVFQDGYSEDGWLEKDRKAMLKAKRERYPDRRRTMGPLEPSTSDTQAPTEEHIQAKPKHRIYWDPPGTLELFPYLKKSYTEACDRAVEREGCHFATIHRGRHRLWRPDGTKAFYMTVSAGRDDDPNNAKRYMRLFEDGEAEWYPTDRLPKKDRFFGYAVPRSSYNKEDGTLTEGVITRPRMRPDRADSSYIDERPSKKPKIGTSTRIQDHGASTSTQLPIQPSTQPSSQPQTDSSHQPSSQPPSRAANSGRLQAPGRGEIDLNFPPIDKL